MTTVSKQAGKHLVRQVRNFVLQLGGKLESEDPYYKEVGSMTLDTVAGLLRVTPYEHGLIACRFSDVRKVAERPLEGYLNKQSGKWDFWIDEVGLFQQEVMRLLPQA